MAISVSKLRTASAAEVLARIVSTKRRACLVFRGAAGPAEGTGDPGSGGGPDTIYSVNEAANR